MGEIAAKLLDAASMFWQALDDHERRLLIIGAAYLVATVALSASERSRQARERDQLVEDVVQRLEGRILRG